ncbi:MAG: hypothetical protein ACI85I_001565 [Arenicella sp.]|jgi:hypothetical protein
MQIKTAKDVEKLALKISEELGIDVSKYRNPEVAESFVDLLIFPKYVINYTVRPIIFSLLLFLVGFFIVDLVNIQYLIYAIFGLVFFVITGFLAGVLFLTYKMKWDIWGIIDYSLNILKSAVRDLGKVGEHVKSENRKDTLKLLFQGIIHAVTIPMISGAISKKVPFFGRFISQFINKVLTLISNKVKFEKTKVAQESEKEESESTALQAYENIIAGATKNLERLMTATFRIAQFPLKILFGISVSLLGVFLWLIW